MNQDDNDYENIREKSLDDFYLVEEVQDKLKEVKTALRHIFVYYSSFGDRNNTNYLKSQKYVKMLLEAQIIPKFITANEADLLYYKLTCNSQNLDLKKFQVLLIELANHIYNSKTQKNPIYLLFQNHFKPLYQNILYHSEFGKIIKNLDQTIQQHFAIILPPIIPVLAKIYNYSFAKISFQVFLTQFELNSLLINNNQAQIIYYEIKQKETNHLVEQLCKSAQIYQRYDLSFEHFIEALIRIAMIYSHQNQQVDQLNAFRLLIQKIEESTGYRAFQQHQSQTQNVKIQLSQIIAQTIEKYQMGSIQPKIKPIENNQAFSVWSNQIFNENINQLKQLFLIYSQKGEHSFKNYLKAHKYKKMLIDAEIIGSYINTAEFDQLCEKIQDGRFSFNAFLKSLEIFATITSQDRKERELLVIIKQKLLPLLEKESQQNLILKSLSELLENEEILNMLPALEKQFLCYFNYFSDQQNHLEWDQFHKFLVSFEIQSALIGQLQLMNIFYALASLNNQTQEIPYLDFQQFIEAICIIGSKIFRNTNDPIMSIVYFIEKLVESKGAMTIKKKQGYTNSTNNSFYQSCKKKSIHQNQDSFDKLIEQGIIENL